MTTDILIVDDEADIRELVAGILQDEGYGTRTAADADQALAAVVARRPNLIFLDIWLQGSRLDGLQLLDTLKQDHPELPIVMISGHGNIETAVKATKLGAFDFIEKPLTIEKVTVVVKNAIQQRRTDLELQRLREDTELPEIIGDSVPMKALRQQIGLMAPTNGRVLIYGESGTGKELVAHAIHG